MSLGLRSLQRPRSGSPRAVNSCLVEEIFLRAETAIYKLFTFHEPHLSYTVVVITLLPLRIPYSHSHTYSFDGLPTLVLVTSRFPLLSEPGDERGRVRVASHKNLTFGQSLPQLTIQLWGKRSGGAPPLRFPQSCRRARPAALVYSCHEDDSVVKKKPSPPGPSLAQSAPLQPASRALLAIAASDATEPPD